MERQTEQRMILLRAMKLATEPVSPAKLQQLAAKHHISRSTLYRTLRMFVADGQIAMVENAQGKPAYVGHVYHQAIFRCQRCGKERRLRSQTLPGYVDRKMFGHQAIITSQLIAQGLCGTCAKKK